MKTWRNESPLDACLDCDRPGFNVQFDERLSYAFCHDSLWDYLNCMVSKGEAWTLEGMKGREC